MIMYPDDNKYVYAFQKKYIEVERLLSSELLLKCFDEMPDVPGMYDENVLICPLQKHRNVPSVEKQVLKQYVELDLGPISKKCVEYSHTLKYSKLGFWEIRVDKIFLRSVSRIRRSSEQYVLEINCDKNEEEAVVVYNKDLEITLNNVSEVVVPENVLQIDVKCVKKSNGRVQSDKHYIDRVDKEEVKRIVKWKPPVLMKNPPNVIIVLIDNISRSLFYRMFHNTLKEVFEKIENGGHQMFDFKRFHVIHTSSQQNQQAQFTGMRYETPFRHPRDDFERRGWKDSLCYCSLYDQFREAGYVTYGISSDCCPDMGEMSEYVDGNRIHCDLYRNGTFKHIVDVSGANRAYCSYEKDGEVKKMIESGYYSNAAHLFDSVIDWDVNFRKTSRPYLSVVYVSEMHNKHLSIQGLHLAMKDFLNNINLDNTILTILADHGPTFTHRKLSRGDAIEHRFPPLLFFLPKEYSERMKIQENMIYNEDKLVNAYDFFKTMSQIPYVTKLEDLKSRDSRSEWKQRVKVFNELGSSKNLFFESVPVSRTCESIHISSELCVCKKLEELSLDSPIMKASIKAIQEYLVDVNRILSSQSLYSCAEVFLMGIDIALYDRKTDTFDILAVFGPGEVVFELWMKGSNVTQWMRVSSMNKEERDMEKKIPKIGELSTRICLLGR